MQPSKIDFRFLFYTSRNKCLKIHFLNVNLLEKYPKLITIYNYCCKKRLKLGLVINEIAIEY